jgi:type I restriction-modification system DNA methylase subunit
MSFSRCASFAVRTPCWSLDAAGITEHDAALCDKARQAFYNTSKFTLKDLKGRSSRQQLLLDFEDYLQGFSPNVQDMLENLTETKGLLDELVSGPRASTDAGLK